MRQRVPGPLQSAATRKTALRVKSATGQSIPHNVATTVVYSTVEFDVLSEYNTSTGIFTAKNSGIFLVSAAILFEITSWPTNGLLQLYVYKNASLELLSRTVVSSACTDYFFVQVTGCLSLSAGNTVRLDVYHNRGSASPLHNSTAWNYMSIMAQ